jgi:hypothetical protein
MLKRTLSLLSILPLLLVATAGSASSGAGYGVTKLVSDVPGEAAVHDPNLVNAWGLVAGPETPW